MGVKSKKKRNSRDSIESSGDGDEKRKKEGAPTSNKKKSSATIGCDIFNEAAMENAYYVCHNVQDVLKSRGFAWPDGQKKKKKGKR